MANSLTRSAIEISIDSKKCTGCAICVEFCSREVLAIGAGCAEVARPDKCTECRLCELICPEPAIVVSHRKE